MTREEWEAEPPWIKDLPQDYAEYLRHRHPEDGTPRWEYSGTATFQSLLLAAILREMRSGRVLVNADLSFEEHEEAMRNARR